MDEADRHGEALLALALSRPADALARAGQLLAEPADALTESYARQARAIVLRDSGRVDEAVAGLRAAVRAARRSPSAERVADVRATLGVTLGFAGRTAQGLAMLDTAVAGCAGGVHGGRVLMRRATVLRLLGRYDEALTDLRRAIDLLRRGGDPIWEARSRSHRFLVYAALGQAARADRDLAIAERLFAAAGQELESAMAVHNRADVALQSGDIPARWASWTRPASGTPPSAPRSPASPPTAARCCSPPGWPPRRSPWPTTRCAGSAPGSVRPKWPR
ncbi:tetratricopeptide repeat protein [Phytohabitans suffuscus]|uniref:tetratricopeptide repeat protein n=1 Tax=Phytohabitans suffuscus TaxID=624315 RepID=UPI001565996C|nr:tetratricopeptide repeat protein [Phytohabitans suffuscus]